MKKLLPLALLAFTLNTYATPPTAPQQLAVKIDFASIKQVNGKTQKYILKNTMTMQTNSHDWMLIHSDVADLTNSDYILLGKVDKADDKEAKMSFLILDASQKPQVLSNPQMIVRYDQKAAVTLKEKEKNDNFELEIQASQLS